MFIYIIAPILLVVSIFFTLKLVNLTDLIQLSVDNFDDLDLKDKISVSLVHQNFIKQKMHKQIFAAIIAISTAVLCCFLTQPITNQFGVGLNALGGTILIMTGPTFVGILLFNLMVALPGSRRFTTNETKKT